MLQLILIDEYDSQVLQAHGEDVRDAVESFKASVWWQSYGADGRVIKQYGNWKVYLRMENQDLKFLGILRNL